MDEEKEQEQEEDPYADIKSIDSNLRKAPIDIEAKKIIHQGVKKGKHEIQEKVKEAEKTLEEKLP